MSADRAVRDTKDAMSTIETQGMTLRYGQRVGVERLDLDVPDGVLFGFLGPNGAGKTTAIRVLLGFLRPTEGAARIFGMDCWRQSHRIKAEVGYLPGDLRLYPWLTGAEAIRIFGRVRRRDLQEPGRRLADQFRLDLTVKVRKMSRGMRQKLGLILALAHKPKLLVLDEPSASLDPLMQDELYQCLRQLAADGHTVFFSSHTLSEVDQLCDRVAILRDGRLVADEPLETLRRRAGRAVSIRFKRGRPMPESPPEFLEVRERLDGQWRGVLTGPVPKLLQWIGGQAIEDLAIGQPDLESLFREFYRNGGPEA